MHVDRTSNPLLFTKICDPLIFLVQYYPCIAQLAKFGPIYVSQKNAEVILQFQILLRQLLGIILSKVRGISC